MSDTKSYTLSVVVFCYNHESFVAKALDSIFDQKRLPRIQLIIADDHSTDRTVAIIQSKINELEHLGWDIHFLAREKRLGMQASVLDAIGRATGKYVALLEGDDYWCDPEKLATQIEALEGNNNAYLCAHNSYLLTNHLERHEWRWKAWKTRFSSSEYLQKNFFHTSSIVMRNPNPLPSWMLSIMQLDFAIVLWGARGDTAGIIFLPRYMSVYRKHAGGISQTSAHKNLQASYDSYLRLLEALREAWPEDRKHLVARRILEAKAMLELSSFAGGVPKIKCFLKNAEILWRPAIVRFMQWISAK